MWLQQRLKGMPGLLSSSWARRMLLVLLLFLIFYWYLTADGGLLKFLHMSRDAGGEAGKCLQTDMNRWKMFAEHGEGVIRGPGSEDVAPFVVGNGHFLVDVESNRLWVSPSAQPGSAPVHQTEFAPNARLLLPGKRQEARAMMLFFRKGSVVSVRCIQPGPTPFSSSSSSSSRECVTVREEYIAHRSRPNVYMQRIHITNPTDRPISLEVTPAGSVTGGDSASAFRPVSDAAASQDDFQLFAGRVPTEKAGTVVAMAVAVKRLAGHVTVGAKGEYTENVVSVVHSSEAVEVAAQGGKAEEALAHAKEAARKEMQEVLRGAKLEEVVQDHQQAWMDLFISGVEIRKIMDAHTPSSLTVNTTLYYVLSASAAPLLDRRATAEERKQLEASLNYADHCFSGHATMHAENLWPERVSSVAQILQLLTLWNLTLQKRGCKVLVAAGVHGMMQGMVLSFGGLQFTENHLQFQADPDVLHNSYSLRGIRYNKDLINLAVLPDAEGKPFLHMSVKPPQPQEKPVKLYACEAGCMNEPVELTSEVKGHTFPVLVTRPITALLYISTDLTHLQDLRHTLHVKAIMAHEDHMAKRYPGLPFLFWFSVASLITLFHLFLFKLIYNEYCGPGAKPLFRSKMVKIAGQETDP